MRSDDEEILKGLDIFFKKKYAPLITKKPVAGCMTIGGLIYIIFCMIMALQLEPPTEQEKWFPDDHMYQQIVDSMATFASAAEDQYIPVTAVFGLGDMNREDKSFWDAKDRGYVVYDDTFDLSSAASQAFFMDACDALIAEPCALEGCLGDTLAMPSSGVSCTVADDGEGNPFCLAASTACDAATDAATCAAAGACKWSGSTCTRRNVWKNGQCWMQQFTDWCAVNSKTCTGASFITEVAAFRGAYDPLYTKAIGIVDGKLKYAQMGVRSTLQEFQPNAITEPVFDAFDALCKKLMASAPATMGKNMFHSGGVFWTWTFTEAQLVTNVSTHAIHMDRIYFRVQAHSDRIVCGGAGLRRLCDLLPVRVHRPAGCDAERCAGVHRHRGCHGHCRFRAGLLPLGDGMGSRYRRVDRFRDRHRFLC